MNNGMNEYTNRAWVNHFSLCACLTQLEHWFLHLDAQLWALISLREHISFSLLRRTPSLMAWGGKKGFSEPLTGLTFSLRTERGRPPLAPNPGGVFHLAHTHRPAHSSLVWLSWSWEGGLQSWVSCISGAFPALVEWQDHSKPRFSTLERAAVIKHSQHCSEDRMR